MIQDEKTRLEILQQVATLNDSFSRGAIHWGEWDERVKPLLVRLNPQLHPTREILRRP